MKVQVELHELLELQARVKELEEAFADLDNEYSELFDKYTKKEVERLQKIKVQYLSTTITDTKGNVDRFPDTDYTMD